MRSLYMTQFEPSEASLVMLRVSVLMAMNVLESACVRFVGQKRGIVV